MRAVKEGHDGKGCRIDIYLFFMKKPEQARIGLRMPMKAASEASNALRRPFRFHKRSGRISSFCSDISIFYSYFVFSLGVLPGHGLQGSILCL